MQPWKSPSSREPFASSLHSGFTLFFFLLCSLWNTNYVFWPLKGCVLLAKTFCLLSLIKKIVAFFGLMMMGSDPIPIIALWSESLQHTVDVFCLFPEHEKIFLMNFFLSLFPGQEIFVASFSSMNKKLNYQVLKMRLMCFSQNFFFSMRRKWQSNLLCSSISSLVPYTILGKVVYTFPLLTTWWCRASLKASALITNVVLVHIGINIH